MRDRTAAEAATTRWAGLAGLIAGLAGLGIAGVTSGITGPGGNPVTAVGELVIELLPAPLVNFGKETLGFADKPVLLALIVVAVLLLCGLAGRLEYRRRLAGAFVFAGIAVLGLLGVSAQPGITLIGYLPTVLGGVFGYLILGALRDRLRGWRAASTADPLDRRRFLTWILATGAAATAATIGGQLLARATSAVQTARERLQLPAAAKPAPPVPAGADLGLPELTPYVTDNDNFYRIDTALQVPVIDPADWSLTITGMVDNPFTLDYATLAAKPLVEHMVTLTCVSNEVGGDLAGNALWLGFPLRELLAEARPQRGADMVLSTSDDGWTAGTPLEVLTDPDRQALLAIGMNGAPLPIEHGFPVRMVVPGLYGYVSATKWVTELKVTTFAADQGYWTPLGWSARGPIKIASRIDRPGGRKLDPGPVVVAGVAWAQHTGIAAVEVQVDGGPWQRARLAETVGPDTWRQWVFDWAAASGDHTLSVRAIDTNGDLQVAASAPPAPDGATGYHSISVRVR
ncbi:MAG TPA: molybdopterin-dependent oxidoreductase [Propionibacteriaceae bacterium]|nr:molybdopterin-dependent oxidoreductase [Propionibacteriaceae bacterium]